MWSWGGSTTWTPDGKAVRGIAAEAGVHIERTQANKDGPVQADRGRMAGGSAVFGAADPGEAAGNGIRRRLQHRQGVCEQPEDGLE